MARQTVRIGSMVDISAYDDVDYDSAIETTQPIKAGAPIDPNDVVILDEFAEPPANQVASVAVIADHAAVRGDGGVRNIQDSEVTISDTGQIGINVAPTYALHVVEAASPTVFLQDTTNTSIAYLQAGNTINRAGSVSNHDFRLQTNSADRVWISNAGVVNVGTAANYTSFAADGIQTMAGDARVINHVRVGAGSWKIGVTGPTEGFLSTFPVKKFDAASDDEVHYSLIVPQRMESGAVITVMVDWCHEDGGPDVGTVCWGLEYRVVASDVPGPVGELVTGATTTILGTSVGNHLQHELVRTTLATGIVGALPHEIIGMRLYRDISGDTLAVDADLIQVHFMYTVNKLGHPVP